MMALSQIKINRLIADWKTGTYTEVALAKKHKIGRTTVRRYCKPESKAENAVLVKKVAEIEQIKSTKTIHEIRAVDEATKRLQKHQQQKDSIVDMALTGTQKNLAFATVQAGDKKTVPTDRASLQRVFKTGLDMVTEKEDKTVVENSINIAQMMHEREDEKIVVPTQVSEMNDEELIQALKDRNLPEPSNEEKLKEMGLI